MISYRLVPGLVRPLGARYQANAERRGSDPPGRGALTSVPLLRDDSSVGLPDWGAKTLPPASPIGVAAVTLPVLFLVS